MANQTILFTVLPRGLRINPATLPVSVLVSPRLQGAERLGEFPDWLSWTPRLAAEGLRLTLRCGAQTLSVETATAPLRPDLWTAMFDRSTFVRSHAFRNDYADRAIFSYSTRLALSVIKSTYQQAGVALALPERPQEDVDDEQRHSPRRQFLKELLSGLEVNWNEREGEGQRNQYRDLFKGLSAQRAAPRFLAEWLAADGTLKPAPPKPAVPLSSLRSGLAKQFGLYTHVPQGAPVHENPPDFERLIDFHQALSSLDSYPELLRALGLVLDFELPADFVAATPFNAPATLEVVDVRRQWAIPTQTVPDMAPLRTAYLYFSGGDPANPFRLFTTAPGVLGGGLHELEVFGLLNLEPVRYGIAQVDVESGMHKTTLLAESWQDGREDPSFPDHPEVFDETTTLPSLRSGGFSLFADARALRLSRTFQEHKDLNADVEAGDATRRPLFAEDLTHGYRVDVWDSFSESWHSLHQRRAVFDVAGVPFEPEGNSEGFTQLAAAQAAPDPAQPTPNDLYLNESMARWNGWSLSVPFPGKALSEDVDPAKALDEDPARPKNEPATPFKVSTRFAIVPKSLPSLRFGRRYRFRLRAVDVAGNGLEHDDPVAAVLAQLSGLPRDPEGFAYLRYEPVAAPTVVLRDERGVTGAGSQLHRLVIRTFNDTAGKDADAADLSAGDRFIVPPGTSVEVGERLGMFDRDGRLDTSAAMYQLIGERDQGRIDEVDIDVAGKVQKFPLVAAETLDALPYLPDVLSRGAALRDLPGSAPASVATAAPGTGAAAALDYRRLADANPRPGSATLIGFGGDGDWQRMLPFRLALADGEAPPAWDPAQRVLTVSLPKGTSAVVPLSSHLRPDDLKLMGIWQWLREHVEAVTGRNPDLPVADARLDSEKIAHLLQRAQEGGHWMLTPPRVLTLVHAVQQPIGSPRFTPLAAQHEPYGTRFAWGVDELLAPDPNVLQTAPESSPTAASELATITAWRRPGSPEAYLLGALAIHAASTDKVELLAEWSDPFDDVAAPREPGRDEAGEYLRHHVAEADEVPVPSTREGYFAVGRGTPSHRRLAYLDADHGLLCFVRAGDRLGNLASGVVIHSDAAPRHYFDDTRRHRVTYRARTTSRYREYFEPTAASSADEAAAEFTRTSDPVMVEVPASARPAAPQVSYVVPTFGWQRQTESNLKRSVRFGGGLRVYLERPWFSSGAGELLGVTFWDNGNGNLTDRELWQPYVTQWGADPIWIAPGLGQLPFGSHFPNKAATEPSLSLPPGAPGRVGVAGFEVAFDYQRQKWFADLTLDVQSSAYTPFVRLALVRYQPFALPDAKLSAAVVADYIQLTPERSAVVTADPYHPRALRVTVSGPTPSGPGPELLGNPTTPVGVPTLVTVRVQRRNPAIATDLGWEEAPELATVESEAPDDPSGLVRWTGTIRFVSAPAPGTCRLVIREHEYVSANYLNDVGVVDARAIREQPKRLIYAETVEIDVALIGGPSIDTGTTLEE